jgi:integrase
MPIYTEDIKQILYEDDVRKMWKLCKNATERLLVSLFWFTGARPAELLLLKRSDVAWGVDELGRDFFAIKLRTKKLNNAGGFVVNERVLVSSRPLGTQANIYIETIINWCKYLEPDDFVVPTRSRAYLWKLMRKITNRIGHSWSPYHFRHSVLTHLAANGASLTTLMYWKGAANVKSVSHYVHAKPVFIRIENQRRGRALMPGIAQPLEKTEVFSAKVTERPATEEEAKTVPEAEGFGWLKAQLAAKQQNQEQAEEPQEKEEHEEEPQQPNNEGG